MLEKQAADMFLILLCVLVGCSLLFALLGIGLNKREVYQCNKWQQYAKTYPDYYLLEWQQEQCDTHNIIIDVPVLK